MQQRALLAVLRGLSLRRCAAWTGLARQTVRRWQAWLAGRHEVFAFHLRSRFGELGRAGALAEFWQTCWRSVSLADAMTWLNRVMVVPCCPAPERRLDGADRSTFEPRSEERRGGQAGVHP